MITSYNDFKADTPFTRYGWYDYANEETFPQGTLSGIMVAKKASVGEVEEYTKKCLHNGFESIFHYYDQVGECVENIESVDSDTITFRLPEGNKTLKKDEIMWAWISPEE